MDLVDLAILSDLVLYMYSECIHCVKFYSCETIKKIMNETITLIEEQISDDLEDDLELIFGEI